MRKLSEKVKSSDVLHIPGFGFDGPVGYSPIAMTKNAIEKGSEKYQQRYAFS